MLDPDRFIGLDCMCKVCLGQQIACQSFKCGGNSPMKGAQKFHIQLTDLNLSAYGSLNLEMFANSSPGLSQNQHHSLGLGCQSSILLLNCLSFNRYKDPSESLFINLKYKNSVSILVTQPTNFP